MTFALLSIFIVSAVMVISSTMSVYYHARGTDYGLQVSEIVFDRIAQELERAEPSEFQSTDSEVGEGAGAMYLGTETVEFMDEEGRHAKIGVSSKNGGQYLQISYYAADKEHGEAADAVTEVWCFDEKAYMGYSIKSLRFSKATEEYLDNVLRVELVLYSPQYGEYTAERYVSCYNFTGDYAEEIVPCGSK